MSYIPNPKFTGSGILAAIPQKGTCPYKCADCFFQSGRSYLEPLDENTPNMPGFYDDSDGWRIIRVNDGNDSSNDLDFVVRDTQKWAGRRFFNTSWPSRIWDYPDPVVLTLNPGDMTDKNFWRLTEIPKTLMFVRFRANSWNQPLLAEAVDHYTRLLETPLVITFMAYHSIESIPQDFRHCYVERKRTTNTYWAITSAAWNQIMTDYTFNKWVHGCGRVEGELGDTHCRHCGNCLREFFATKERMNY